MASPQSSIPKEQKLVGFDGSKSDGRSFRIVEFIAPTPTAGDDDVLVHVSHSSINPGEYKLASNNFFGRKDHVALGFDFAGQVAAVGKNVTHVKPGDDVFGLLYLFQTGGWSADGKGAYQIAPKGLVVKRDPQFPAEAAATYPVAFLSAWDGIAVNLKPGQSVYIPGVAGGVAHFAVQGAKTKTDKVVTSASRPSTEHVAKQLNVPSFNYKTADVETEVKKHFPHGASVVYDATYQVSSFVESAKALAPGGKLVVLGQVPTGDSEAGEIVAQKGGEIVQADLMRYYTKPDQFQQSFLQQGLERAQQWYIEGKVRPIISKTITANVRDIQQALEESKAGKSIGKVAVQNVY